MFSSEQNPYLSEYCTIIRIIDKNSKEYMAKEVTKRSENYSQWYNDLVVKADLAEQSAVRGMYGDKALWLRDLGEDAARP